VTRGVDEPYRLVSRRDPSSGCCCGKDNALRRLAPLAERLGLLTVAERRWRPVVSKKRRSCCAWRALRRSPRAPLPPALAEHGHEFGRARAGRERGQAPGPSRYARCFEAAGRDGDGGRRCSGERRDRALKVRWISRCASGRQRHGWPSSRRLRCRQNLPYLEFHQPCDRSAAEARSEFDRRPSLRRRDSRRVAERPA